jgi:hypothetical protein
MASLALLVAVIIFLTILVGPVTYLFAKIGFPSIIIYILSLLSILIGINFCLIPTPVWYLGLLPIYCGYISIRVASKK